MCVGHRDTGTRLRSLQRRTFTTLGNQLNNFIQGRPFSSVISARSWGHLGWTKLVVPAYCKTPFSCIYLVRCTKAAAATCRLASVAVAVGTVVADSIRDQSSELRSRRPHSQPAPDHPRLHRLILGFEYRAISQVEPTECTKFWAEDVAADMAFCPSAVAEAKARADCASALQAAKSATRGNGSHR